MPKRRLWITCEDPLIGMCEYCNTKFSGGQSQLAKSDIQEQFNRHKCKSEDVNPAPVRDSRAP